MCTHTKRMQFEFPKQYHDLLMRTKEETDAPSCAEIVKRALKLYVSVRDASANGNELCIRGADGNVIPVLLLEI